MHSIIYSEEKELAVQRLTAQVKPRGGKMGNISDKGSGKRHAGRPVGMGMESEVFCFTSSCPSESIYDRGRGGAGTKRPKHKTTHLLSPAGLCHRYPRAGTISV